VHFLVHPIAAIFKNYQCFSRKLWMPGVQQGNRIQQLHSRYGGALWRVTLRICAVIVAFALFVMGKRCVVHKTGST